jgi:hypothetical protein
MPNLEASNPVSCIIGAAALFVIACTLAPFEGRTAETAGDEANRLMQERFQKLDTNSDGKLSAAEVGSRRLFTRMDADGDGFVTKEEAKTARTIPPTRTRPRPYGGVRKPPTR